MKRHPSSRSFSAVVTGLLVALAMAANGRASILLNFEGLADSEPIANYYNGGRGGSNSGPGPSNGITFGADAVALTSSTTGGSLDFTENPSGHTILHFAGSAHAVMDVPAGFTDGLSLYFAENAEWGSTKG